MKLTKMQLLQAIGQADEKLIDRTAPKESGNAAAQPLLRIRRRAFEMLAVCAALCVFIGGGLLIRNLYHADMDDPSIAAANDEAAARAALENFLEVCKKGDREQIMDLSLIEYICNAIDDNPDSAAELIASYRDGFAMVSRYQIDTCKDITEVLEGFRQNEQDLCELYAYRLKEKGNYEEAEKLFTENPALDYYNRVDKGYSFWVRLSGSPADQWAQYDMDLCGIQVVRYDGKWYIQPVEYLSGGRLSEEGKEKLAQYRAADPEYRK
ncbi:MAG: hypothetical protein J6S92_00770 [Oscillospiraceae bacterium]|nr:hypothetical protein [Oscillospiraceae bacterium]